jgi:signal transduction histidine kinase
MPVNAGQRAVSSPHRQAFNLATITRYLLKDGGVIWTEVDAFLAPVAASEPLLAGVAVDITERKLAEEALRDARADVERMARLTTMGELTASIAHEINQPLAAIVTQSEATLRFPNRGEPNLDEVQDALSWIRRGHARGRGDPWIGGARQEVWAATNQARHR